MTFYSLSVKIFSSFFISKNRWTCFSSKARCEANTLLSDFPIILEAGKKLQISYLNLFIKSTNKKKALNSQRGPPKFCS